MPDETPNQADLSAQTNQQAKAELPKPQYMAPAEDLMQGTKLQKAYDAAKDWLGEHEQHLSDKYLAPFRTGLDNMAADLKDAAATGHTKSGGQMTPVTRALAEGAGSLLEQVPVGKNVKETAGMAALGALPEGHLFGDIEGVRSATPKEIIEGEKLVYKGELTKGSDVHMFEHPDHPGQTASLNASELNPKSVREKIDSKIKEFSDGEKTKSAGQKVYYHGTKAPIKSIEEADPLGHGDTGALAGIGTYLTDKPEVASGYSVGKKPGNAVAEGGRVLAGKLNPNAKILDLDKPAAPEIRESFAKEIKGIFGDTKISDSQLDNDYFRAPGDKGNKSITVNDLFDGVRRAMTEEGYSNDSATEVMQSIATELKHTHGYDVLQYEGGKRIPRYGSHTAVVVLPDMMTGGMPKGMVIGTVPSKAAEMKKKVSDAAEKYLATKGR
jgi:hypothetical protein